MRIQSPLSDLRLVLSEVKDAAASQLYQKTLKSNEDATRAALVDPVLRALGWDIGNPNMVEVEKTLNSTKPSRVDYALYDINHIINVIVEAKPLGQPLGSHAQQLVQYAFGFQVTSLFLTNGLIWHHYTNFSPNNFVPTRVLDLASDNLVDVAAFLVKELDAANFWPDQPDVDTLAQDVSQLRNELLTLQQQVAQLIKGTPPPPPPPPTLKWTNLDAIGKATKTQPSQLRLPDGSQVRVKYWRDVLAEVCKFVLANVATVPVPLPDRSGLKVNLLDTSFPPKGIAFITETYRGQSVYVRTHYDADNHVANALYILKQLPSSFHGIKTAVVYTSV